MGGVVQKLLKYLPDAMGLVKAYEKVGVDPNLPIPRLGKQADGR